jgi:hypothetical protein
MSDKKGNIWKTLISVVILIFLIMTFLTARDSKETSAKALSDKSSAGTVGLME